MQIYHEIIPIKSIISYQHNFYSKYLVGINRYVLKILE